ncbi:MAG: hypothetical protein KAH07_06920, partial [Flavobacteriaceae bacterium]|nr:hypothetical protein [Flavobacteriaceae bacterium]
HDHDHDHEKNEEHEHSHSEIIELLAGVDLLIVKNIGKYMKKDLDKSKIKYQRVTEPEIKNVINKYQKEGLK